MLYKASCELLYNGRLYLGVFQNSELSEDHQNKNYFEIENIRKISIKY